MSSQVANIWDGLPTWARYASAVVALILIPKITSKIWNWVVVCVTNRLKGSRKTPVKDDWKQDIIYVYQWPRMRTVPSPSPYSLKLETWLRMAGLQYENVKTPLLLRSKEGMLPFVELNGVEYADSGFIMRDLSKLFDKEEIMEGHLTTEQKATSRALEKMLEMNTWWSYDMVRYVENSDKMLRAAFECMSPSRLERVGFQVLLFFVGGLANSHKTAMTKAGIGKHSRQEIIEIGLEDLKALSHYLGAKDYLMGDKPTKIDAVAFGMLSQWHYFTTIDSPHAQLMKEDEYSNLARFMDRMRDRFWPDWKQLGETLQLNTHLNKR